jgi:uncharacterized protein YidB (DUF937 family)
MAVTAGTIAYLAQTRNKANGDAHSQTRVLAHILCSQKIGAPERNHVGILDSLTNLAEGFSGGGDHAAVAGGLLEELGGSGGVAGLIQSFNQNGAGGLIQQFASGQTQATDPNAIEQALAGTGLIDGVAQRTGMSSDAVKSSLGTVVPLLVNHVTANGHVTTDGQPTGNPVPDAGTLIQSALGSLFK